MGSCQRLDLGEEIGQIILLDHVLLQPEEVAFAELHRVGRFVLEYYSDRRKFGPRQRSSVCPGRDTPGVVPVDSPLAQGETGLAVPERTRVNKRDDALCIRYRKVQMSVGQPFLPNRFTDVVVASLVLGADPEEFFVRE